MKMRLLTGSQLLSCLGACVFFLQIFFTQKSFSQDLRLFSIASPADGCMLGNQENVSIIIINVGPQLLNASFDATYKLNNGVPVTETIMLPPVFNNGSLISYTFSSPADLSLPTTYSFDSYISLAGDVNRTNDTITNYSVTSYPLSVGGTVSGSTTVCSGTNSGSLTLTGNTGSVINWESSIDGVNWTAISNQGTSQNFLNLTATTIYRAVVKSGLCSTEYSSADTIIVDPVTLSGTIASSATVCPGSSGTLTLSGYNGNILNWESSTNGGSSWNNISNTGTTHSYSNILTETIFRARIKSGVCTDKYSATATIGLLAASVGGTTSGTDTVCSGSNSGSITLSGHTGNVIRWERSLNGGATWLPVSNTSATLSYSNITSTTIYRAVVMNCNPEAISTETTIQVNSAPVAGTLTGAATVCASTNSGTLILTGHSGTITWQSSTDGLNWNIVPGNAATLSYTDLSATTYYRAEVSSPPCSPVFSNIVIITVDPETVSGTLTGSNTVCITGNSGMLELTQYTGTVLKWESSNDNGATWTTISNTTDQHTYLNLTTTTQYRVHVKSGVCAAQISTPAEVLVITATEAGSITGEDTICSGTATNLSITGLSGNIEKWQFSEGDSLSWTDLSDTTTTIITPLIYGPVYFRMIAGTGTCGTDTTSSFLINVISVNGSAGSDTTINKGSEIALHATGGLSYEWSPSSFFTDVNSADPTVAPEETTTFTLLITGQKNCMDTASIVITVENNIPLLIPNLVSPNSDGINDTWEISGLEKYSSDVMIFNSSGQVIFTANPFANNWDAIVNGATVPDGTYYYKLVLTDTGGVATTYKGNINIKSR